MSEARALPGKVKGYALLRDVNGKPKIDNIHGIPAWCWDMLNEEERQDITDRGGYPETTGE